MEKLMNTLTTKLMSATLGLALVLGASVAMTAASSVVTASEASARTLNSSKMRTDRGRKTERSKIDFGKLKQVKQVERERLIDAGGKKADFAKRLREKKVPGRG
jgi:hypothetical protein